MKPNRRRPFGILIEAQRLYFSSFSQGKSLTPNTWQNLQDPINGRGTDEAAPRVDALRAACCFASLRSSPQICIAPEPLRPNRESSHSRKTNTRRLCAARAFFSARLQDPVAVLENGKAVFSALAAPRSCIVF